jgi:hypothetical protein
MSGRMSMSEATRIWSVSGIFASAHERATLISVGRSGTTAGLMKAGGFELVRIESRERKFVDAPAPAQFGFGAGGLWLLASGSLHWMSESGRCVAESYVGDGGGGLAVSRGALPAAVFRAGDGRLQLLELFDGELFASDIDWVGAQIAYPSVIPIGPRTLAVGGPEALCLVHVDRGKLWSHLLPTGGTLRAATALFSGTSVAALIDGPRPLLWVMSPSGEPLMGMDVCRPDIWAVAEDRGLIFIGTGRILCAIDLLDDGRKYWAEVPFIPDALDVCARGREIVLAQRVGDNARVWHAGFVEVFKEELWGGSR